MQFDLLISNGHIVNNSGIHLSDIGIKEGKITAIRPQGQLHATNATHNIDANGLHVLPGVIDTQVHFREPGPIHKEDLQTGSRAAVLGGVTGVFEMPNTNPNTSTTSALEDKLNRARNRMHCNYAFYVGGTHDNINDLPELERLPGCCGVKVFMGASTGDLLVGDDKAIDEILQKIQRRASFHCEDENRLSSRRELAIEGDYSSHTTVRDTQSALLATQRLLALAQKNKKRVHVLHVSTADELSLLAKHKSFASAEVTPQHLTLYAPDCYEELKGRAQMNPPIRDISHRNALWKAVQEGLFDILATDHAPHTLEEKSHLYPASPSGMPGVQTMVPIMLDWVNKGALSLPRFVDLTSASVSRVWGLAGKGRLALGYDADITIVDMQKENTLVDENMATKSKWTPYHGRKVKGWPLYTIIDGKIIMQNDVVCQEACGRAYQFSECL